jgi:hypothetical protein
VTPFRTVTIAGEQLLLQACEPQLPADIAFNERVRVVPPRPPWQPASAAEAVEFRRNPDRFPQFDGRYWRVFENNQHPTDSLWGWVNDPGNGMPGVGNGHGLDRVPPVVEFKFKPKARKLGLPDFWEKAGVFVVSTRLLDVLLDVDPEAIVHRPVVMRDLDDVVFDEDHHLIDVVRVIPALDYANSVIEYRGPEHCRDEVLPARVESWVSIRIRADMDESVHLFRQAVHHLPGVGGDFFVSAALKRRLEKMKPKPRNLRFGPLYSPTS